MAARFTRHRYRLFDRGQELLIGPEVELEVFRRWLTADPPRDTETLRTRVCDMIRVSRGCSFVYSPGIALRDGQS